MFSLYLKLCFLFLSMGMGIAMPRGLVELADKSMPATNEGAEITNVLENKSFVDQSDDLEGFVISEIVPDKIQLQPDVPTLIDDNLNKSVKEEGIEDPELNQETVNQSKNVAADELKKEEAVVAPAEIKEQIAQENDELKQVEAVVAPAEIKATAEALSEQIAQGPEGITNIEENKTKVEEIDSLKGEDILQVAGELGDELQKVDDLSAPAKISAAVESGNAEIVEETDGTANIVENKQTVEQIDNLKDEEISKVAVAQASEKIGDDVQQIDDLVTLAEIKAPVEPLSGNTENAEGTNSIANIVESKQTVELTDSLKDEEDISKVSVVPEELADEHKKIDLVEPESSVPVQETNILIAQDPASTVDNEQTADKIESVKSKDSVEQIPVELVDEPKKVDVLVAPADLSVPVEPPSEQIAEEPDTIANLIEHKQTDQIENLKSKDISKVTVEEQVAVEPSDELKNPDVLVEPAEISIPNEGPSEHIAEEPDTINNLIDIEEIDQIESLKSKDISKVAVEEKVPVELGDEIKNTDSLVAPSETSAPIELPSEQIAQKPDTITNLKETEPKVADQIDISKAEDISKVAVAQVPVDAEADVKILADNIRTIRQGAPDSDTENKSDKEEVFDQSIKLSETESIQAKAVDVPVSEITPTNNDQEVEAASAAIENGNINEPKVDENTQPKEENSSKIAIVNDAVLTVVPVDIEKENKSTVLPEKQDEALEAIVESGAETTDVKSNLQEPDKESKSEVVQLEAQTLLVSDNLSESKPIAAADSINNKEVISENINADTIVTALNEEKTQLPDLDPQTVAEIVDTEDSKTKVTDEKENKDDISNVTVNEQESNASNTNLDQLIKLDRKLSSDTDLADPSDQQTDDAALNENKNVLNEKPDDSKNIIVDKNIVTRGVNVKFHGANQLPEVGKVKEISSYVNAKRPTNEKILYKDGILQEKITDIKQMVNNNVLSYSNQNVIQKIPLTYPSTNLPTQSSTFPPKQPITPIQTPTTYTTTKPPTYQTTQPPIKLIMYIVTHAPTLSPTNPPIKLPTTAPKLTTYPATQPPIQLPTQPPTKPSTKTTNKHVTPPSTKPHRCYRKYCRKWKKMRYYCYW